MADYRTPRRPASRRIGVELRRCGILNFHTEMRAGSPEICRKYGFRLRIKMESRAPAPFRFSVLSRRVLYCEFAEYLLQPLYCIKYTIIRVTNVCMEHAHTHAHAHAHAHASHVTCKEVHMHMSHVHAHAHAHVHAHVHVM